MAPSKNGHQRTRPDKPRWRLILAFSLAWACVLPVGWVLFNRVLPVSAVVARERPACFDDDTVQVSISGHLFAIPIAYRPHIVTIGPASVFPENGVTHPQCRKGMGRRVREPIEANRASIRTLTEEQARRADLPVLHRVPIQLLRRSPDRPYERLKIKNFMDKLERVGRRIEDLPQFAGFYAFDQVEGKIIYIGPFMTVPGGTRTPSGMPIVVDCGDPVAPSPHLDPPGPNASCTVEYEWAPGVVISYSFGEGSHPIDKWPELDAAIRIFMRQLVVPSK